MMINLEIDEGLAAQLEAAARARGLTSRDFIRTALRQAVATPVAASPGPPFTQKKHDFGAHLDTAWTLLAELESEEHMRKHARK